MNKKFSTLLTAGLLVGGSLFSYVDAAVIKTPEDLAKYLEKGVLTLPADDNELEFAADGKYSLTGGYMVVKNENVKIFASAGKKVEITGRLIIAKDGVSVSNLHFVNQANGDGGYWNMNTISVFADKVTLTGNTIEIKAAEGEAIGNGIVVFPQNEKVSYTISGNKIIGAFSQQEGYASTGILLSVNSEINKRESQKDQPLVYGTDFKAVTANVKEGLNASAIAKANTYENCFIDLVQHEGVVLTGDNTTNGAYAYSQVSFDEKKTYNADALNDAIESATEDGSIDFKGTAAQLEDLTKELASNVAINTNDGIVISGVARLQPSIETAAGVYNLLAAKPTTDEYNLLVRYSEWNGGKGSFIVTVDKDGKPGQIELEDLTAEQATADNNLWKMEQYLDKDGDYTFIFTNKADQKLTVDGKSFFHSVGNAPYDNGVVFEMDEKDLSAKTPKYYGLYKAGIHTMTAGELNFIENDGFSITITPKDLIGNPFAGKLAPMTWNGTKFVSTNQKSGNTEYYLKNAEGDYIVAKLFGAEGGNKDQAYYVFATATEKDLIDDLKATKLENRKLFGEFRTFYKPETANDDMEKIDRIDSMEVKVLGQDKALHFAPVGYANISTTDKTEKTLTASIKSAQYPISFSMGSNVVDPAAFLKKAFFTFTKLNDENGDKILAVKGCNQRGLVKEVSNDLDAQWAITYDEESATYTVVNRENKDQYVGFTFKKNELRENGDKKDNIYEFKGELYKIAPVEKVEVSDGYNWLGDVKNQRFHIAHYSSVYENNAWISADKDGNAILNLDEDAAVEFVANKGRYNSYDVDTVFVVSKLGYYADTKFTTEDDTLKVPVYRFYNVAGQGFQSYNSDNKYSFASDYSGQLLAIRESGDKKYILRHVYGSVDNYQLDCEKIYAGTSTNFLSNCGMYEVNNSLFVVEPLNRPEYRRLGETVANDGFKDLNVNLAKFFRTNVENTFLYENSANRNANNGNGIAKDSLNFLGEVNLADKPASAALPLFVDTAFVRNDVATGEPTTKPLYMLAVRNTDMEEDEIVVEPCDATNHQHITVDGEKTDDASKCVHATTKKVLSRKAEYLVALTDTAYLNKENRYSVANPQALYQGDVRLAFVPATHFENDTLVIASSRYTGTKEAAKDTLSFVNEKGEQQMNAATFAFRLVDPAAEDGAFYIEAEPRVYNYGDGTSWSAPQYVRIHNSVPVLVTNLDQAATFNVEATDEAATSNEGIATSEVKVIAGEGQVTIAGAAGKKVVISNILGQVVANTVLASDNAVIAAPQGVVVVAVEGEEAVKAIVK